MTALPTSHGRSLNWGSMPWDADLARALVSLVVRRVAAAHDRTPPSRRLDSHALLQESDAALWRAYRAQDHSALCRAASCYLDAATSIFERWYASQPRDEVTA